LAQRAGRTEPRRQAIVARLRGHWNTHTAHKGTQTQKEKRLTHDSQSCALQRGDVALESSFAFCVLSHIQFPYMARIFPRVSLWMQQHENARQQQKQQQAPQ
jgi:hypothetical protein